MKKNDVRVNGQVIWSEPAAQGLIALTVATSQQTIRCLVGEKVWEKFQRDFPNTKNIQVSGILSSFFNGTDLEYQIEVRNLSRFHNLLKNEDKIDFCGNAKIIQSADLGQYNDSMYLKKLSFETANGSRLEAIALRGTAKDITSSDLEDSELVVKAQYVTDGSGHPPYWRLKNRPMPVVIT